MEAEPSQGQLINLVEARSVGIVYDLSDTRNHDKVKNYVRYLENEGKKQVMALGFLDEKEIPDQYLSKIDFSYFCRSDLNLYFKPGGTDVENFISSKYDILLDLSAPGLLPTQFIVQMSQARFKVGKQVPGNLDLYDLSLSVKEEGVVYLIKQMDHYLKMLNGGKQHA